MIALVVDEYLRLVDQAAEGGRMQHAVAIALEGAPRRTGQLGMAPPARRNGAGRIGRRRAFAGLQRLSEGEIGGFERGSQFFHCFSEPFGSVAAI
jgi:hypothetical protein